MKTAAAPDTLVDEAQQWAKKLGRGRLADLLVRLSAALQRQAQRGKDAIPAGYQHAASRLDEIGQRIGGADGKDCEAGALFIRELGAEVFLGVRGPA